MAKDWAAIMANLPPDAVEYIQRLRRDAAKYRVERNQASAEAAELEARYAALAPELAEAVARLTEYEALKAEFGIEP